MVQAQNYFDVKYSAFCDFFWIFMNLFTDCVRSQIRQHQFAVRHHYMNLFKKFTCMCAYYVIFVFFCEYFLNFLNIYSLLCHMIKIQYIMNIKMKTFTYPAGYSPFDLLKCEEEAILFNSYLWCKLTTN